MARAILGASRRFVRRKLRDDNEMTEAERYAALRALYLHWHARTGDEYHAAMADYAGMMADRGE